MKVSDFKESNLKYAEDQDEYITLPVYKTKHGRVTSCFSFTLVERLKFLLLGKMYFTVLTFNKPLQPQKPHINFRDGMSNEF